LVSDRDFVSICRDKRKTNLFFEKSGIEINPRFGGGYPLSYHAKADFLIDDYDSLSVIPLEVKSGKNYFDIAHSTVL
jgi:carbamoylphosphate synthase large subunit